MRVLGAMAVLIIAACGQAGGASSLHRSPSPSPSPPAAVVATPDVSPSAPPAPSSTPTTEPSPSPAFLMPNVQCVPGMIPISVAQVSDATDTILYDVGDPLRPRAVCHLSSTTAHVLTGTSFEYLVP